MKSKNALGQETYLINIPGIGFEACRLAKEQKEQDKATRKKRTKADDENMIHKSFLKSAMAYKLKEQKLFKKMEERLEEETLHFKMK